jgi:hypothetical protein
MARHETVRTRSVLYRNSERQKALFPIKAPSLRVRSDRNYVTAFE